MACQELRTANLEKQKKSEAYQNGFIKSYTYSYHSISLVCLKKSANQSTSVSTNVKIKVIAHVGKTYLL